MEEPVPPSQSPPPPTSPATISSTFSLTPGDDLHSQQQKPDAQEQGREGEDTLPKNPNCNLTSDPPCPQNPQSLYLYCRNPSSPNFSDLPPGSVDIHNNQQEGEGEGEGEEENLLQVDELDEMLEVEDSEGALIARSPPPATRSSRRGAQKRKKRYLAKQALVEKKLQTLLPNLKAFPFEPVKFRFSQHEEPLKRLGLWDFAHIEFDRKLRVDLIGKLIVGYNQSQRCSYVDGNRIMVNRADLGRALHLHWKKPGELKAVDGVQETKWPDKFVSFVDNFVSNWMLLHGDMWVFPSEILNWTRMIKDGNLEKVDWPRLIWFMVEKELLQGINLKECYYASHLQHLIKVQKEELFEEVEQKAIEEVSMTKEYDDVDNEGDTKMAKPSHGEFDDIQLSLGTDFLFARTDKVGPNHDNMGDACVDNVSDADVGGVDPNDGDDDNIRDPNIGSVNNVGNVNGVGADNVGDVNAGIVCSAGNMKIEGSENVENTQIRGDEYVEKLMKDVGEAKIVEAADGLLGEETRDTDMLNLEHSTEDEQNQWFSAENNRAEHFLQRCSTLNDKQNGAYEQAERNQVGEHLEVVNDEIEGTEQVEGFKTQQKYNSFGGLSSGPFIQPMESSQVAFSTDFGGHPSLDLLSPRVDNQVMLGVPAMFSKANKRHIDHEPDISHNALNDSHHALNDSNKRFRTDGPWDSEVHEFEFCMNQMQDWMGKARLAHASTAERTFQQANMNQQLLYNELDTKDRIIQQLKANLEELQKRQQAESVRSNIELSAMSSLIDGYRRTLRDTQKAFADYRKRFPLPAEPLYRDAGLGGVMKSVSELETERMMSEHEEKAARLSMLDTVDNYLNEANVFVGGYLDQFESLGRRLTDMVKHVQFLKETRQKRMASETGAKDATDKEASSEPASDEKTSEFASDEKTSEVASDGKTSGAVASDEKTSLLDNVNART